MARARSIKPGFFQNEFMASKRPEVQLLYLGLLTIADREGRLEDRPLKIKSQVFPYSDVDVDSALNELGAIDDPFQDKPFIYRYVVDGRRYIQIVNWDKHQNVHPKEPESVIPSIASSSATYGHPESRVFEAMHEAKAGKNHDSEVMHEVNAGTSRVFEAMHEPCMNHARVMHGEKTAIAEGKEGIEGEEGKENTNPPLKVNSKSNHAQHKFTPPKVQEVASYIKSKGYQVDAETFVDFYESKGWVVGKVPMRDWQASVRTWHAKAQRESPSAQQREGPFRSTQEVLAEQRKKQRKVL